MEQAKRECILSEAVRAFTQFGFKKASVDEIAKRAGVAKGTIYLAAESKEDLFYQALRREVQAWTAEVSQVIDPAVPADQLIPLAAITSAQRLEHHPLVRDLLYGDCPLLLVSGWHDRIDGLRELGGANVREILRIGIKQKVFRDDIDIDEVASILQDVQLSTFIFHGHHADRAERFAKRGKSGVDLVLNGLKPRTHGHHHS
ncbi:MAG: TetR/AcrR family transcriptional regulator [Deltaproteobacteria bacterium]|nr:TetR/AcrR family transcriptional regulator [Deltaproteobacteria bacterium]